MAEATVVEKNTPEEAENLLRVYEIGYHVSPSTKEEEIESVVTEIRSTIEKAGGKFLAEGAPSLTKLAYAIEVREDGKRLNFDRGYFGWIKFEFPPAHVGDLAQALRLHKALLRSIVFETVREETRARFKTPTLREVKRTNTIKAAPRAVEENAGPVSEAQLEKALEDLTAE